MNALVALVGVVGLVLLAIVGLKVPGLNLLFQVILPYAAAAVLIAGVVARIVAWAKVPVPFRITTTTGQQKSLDWIEHSKLDNPHTKAQAFGRMLLEVLLFRSLFRNHAASLTRERTLVYGYSQWLWLGAIVFHYCFLLVLIRHMRFFLEPVPTCLVWLERLDGMMQTGLPAIYLTSFGLLLGLLYLLARRLFDAKVRIISLPADYFALLLILGIAITGALLRYTAWRTDIFDVKAVVAGWLSFKPHILTSDTNPLFAVHLLLVNVLMFYFPFSKLMHAGGVFFSPTRNLPNDNRARRHVNPWADELPSNTHTYAEWEEEFADVMQKAGLELDKES